MFTEYAEIMEFIIAIFFTNGTQRHVGLIVTVCSNKHFNVGLQNCKTWIVSYVLHLQTSQIVAICT